MFWGKVSKLTGDQYHQEANKLRLQYFSFVWLKSSNPVQRSKHSVTDSKKAQSDVKVYNAKTMSNRPRNNAELKDNELFDFLTSVSESANSTCWKVLMVFFEETV